MQRLKTIMNGLNMKAERKKHGNEKFMGKIFSSRG